MGEITVKEVVSRKQLRDFIRIPAKVHKDDPVWLPPIYMDDRVMFNKKKNKSYNYADAILLVAYRDHKPVGRIMGIINRRYNEIHQEQNGRFCFMECYDDQDVFHTLLVRVEEWAKESGMVRLVGPLAFSDKDPQGFLIEGFDYPQFINSQGNNPYMVSLVEAEGYEKKVDLVNYLGKLPKEFPPVYEKVIERMKRVDGYKIVEFASKKQLRPYIIPILELMNETFKEIYGFVPLTDKEKSDLAATYMFIINPGFVKAVEHGGELIGFAIGIPDLSPGIKACRGRLFPFGFIKVLNESKRSKKLLMLLGGVKKEFRGRGIEVLMGVKILQEGIASNMEMIDSHLVLENNTRMRAEYERIGCSVVKKFRIYQKDL